MRKETIENEFVEQLRQLLYSSFPKKLGFKIEFFIGEDSGTRGIYIEVVSEIFGTVYAKRKYMEDFQTIFDVEDEFINEVINDFVLAGMSFLNGEAVRQKEEDRLAEAITSKKFKNIMPSRIIHLN